MSAPAASALPAPVDDWIASLRLIPAEDREYTIDLRAAEATFTIDRALAHELIARGLPCATEDGEPRFALTDLHYIALRLGLPMTQRTAMRSWAAALMGTAQRAWTDVEVRCSPYAPPGTAVEVLVAPGDWRRATTGPNRVATTIAARATSRWPALPPELDELVREIAALDFCILPTARYGDAELARRTRLADCGSSAYLLAEECARLGVEARTSFGLLLARPYATPHHWTDVRAGETWVPTDPLLLALLAAYTDLDAAQWPPGRSPGGVLLRLADRQTPLVRAEGRELRASFRVTQR